MNSFGKNIFKNFAGFCLLLLMFIPLQKASAANFTVTGYYSPLPKQEFYLTGDYKSELRLNGKGIQGADGTKVYHGMIAAPKNYKFGTNICLAKLGCGTVHDRGGAIVNKGERKKAVNDRLDFWMGHGTEGLEKSLLWGVQNVNGSFSNSSLLKKRRTIAERKQIVSPILLEVLRKDDSEELFSKNLYLWKNDPEVSKLKESLKFLGKFRGKINEQYTPEVQKAVLDFQLENQIISSDRERGAGGFGPKTREKMEEIINQKVNEYLRSKWTTNVFQENLSVDDHGMDIFRLQQILIDRGLLDVSPTGYFGKQTEEAIKKFQLEQGLIRNKNSVGAGNFGPKTREKMTELWLAKRDSYFPVEQTEPQLQVVKENKSGVLVAEAGTKLSFLGRTPEPEIKKEYFGDDVILFRGKRNEDVRKLQKELKKLDFFTGNTTGFYGDETAEAVLSFQFKHGIVENRRSIGASIFGPSTRAKMNTLM